MRGEGAGRDLVPSPAGLVPSFSILPEDFRPGLSVPWPLPGCSLAAEDRSTPHGLAAAVAEGEFLT